MYGEPPCVAGYFCQKNNLPAGSGGGWCVKGTAPTTTTAKPTTTTKKFNFPLVE